MDVRHFVERAAGVGRLAEQAGGFVGCFSGRGRELQELWPWLNGDRAGSLRLVTGSPGVGKSVLLGVLVCAGHPRLNAPMRGVWKDVTYMARPIDALIAVHARRRGLTAVLDSIARQLGIDDGLDGLSATELLAAVAALELPPVMVLDALDAADEARAITEELLVPLVSAVREDGRPVARLLVGVRDYPDLAPLIALARDQGGLENLDEVPPTTLRRDFYSYVDALLQALPRFFELQGGVTAAFAHAVARALAEPVAHAAGERQWGPFLVAGLYTCHLVVAHPRSVHCGP